MAEDLSGKQFGDLKVIGDTGKRSKSGNQIVIARDSDGNIHEYLARSIKNGTATGYLKSELIKIKGRKSIEEVHRKTIHNGCNVSILQNNAPNKLNKTGYKHVSFANNHKRWNVLFKRHDFEKNQYFINFYDAVKFSKELRDKYVYPMLNDEEKEIYLKSYKNEIVENDYVKEKQKEIIQSIKDEKIKKLKKTIEKYKKTKGVTFDKATNNWRALITIDKKRKNLGAFKNEQDAKAARQKAVNEQIKKLENEMERI